MICRGRLSIRVLILSAICLAAVIALGGRSASATVISNYNFTGNPPSTSVAAPVAGATFSSFTRTNLVADTQPNVFRTKGFTTSSTLDTTQYEGFTVTASGAVSLTFEGLSFDTNRSGQGPQLGAIQYFIDNVLTDSFFYAIPEANVPGNVWNFPDFVLNPGQMVEFRFYGYDANTGDGFFTLDNVGFVSAPGPVIPEPSSVLLVVTGAVLGLGGRFVTKRGKRHDA